MLACKRLDYCAPESELNVYSAHHLPSKAFITKAYNTEFMRYCLLFPSQPLSYYHCLLAVIVIITAW